MLPRRLAAAAPAALTAALLILPGVAAGAQTGDQALVRVAHFAPGLLKGDVYVDGRLQLKGVRFQTVSNYLKVKPGKFKVEVRKAGEPADSPPVIAATVSLEAGKAYTVAVFGQLTSVKAALLTDDMPRPGNGESKLRLIQAIPGEEAVDLVSGSGEVLAKADNVKLASGSISSLVAVGGVGEKLELLDISDAATAVSAAGGGGASLSPNTGWRRFAPLLLIGGGLAATAGFVVQQRRSTG